MPDFDQVATPVTVDYQTTLEKFIFPAAFIALLGIVLSLVNFFWVVGYLHELSIYGLPLTATLFAVLVFLMFGFSSRYEFDSGQRVVCFRIRLFGFSRAFKVAGFNEISGFSVSGIRGRARIQTWWSYRVVMLFRSGRIMPVSNALDQSVHALNRLAEKLAGTTGCQFFPGEAEKVLQLPVAGEQPVIEFHDWTISDYLKEFWAGIALSVLFFAGILFFIIFLVVSLS
ncbi:MAG TPA: hypothetical protein PLM07_08295 [Candidatus Rifleibacterium sp.]|nr:hypothetical protein [Candidatus Rifleibacterium sp.]HPT45885.1 hypothetical protein [Candidatus Rifleibacterium sp.]